jgi:hypothetical protein
VYHLHLNLERQRGRQAVGVDLDRVETFGLEEDLVARLVGEANDLVLDGRTVSRSSALDVSPEDGRSGEIRAHDPMGGLGGVGEVARDLGMGDAIGAEGERWRGIVAVLDLETGKVDGARVQARAGTSLEPADAEPQSFELRAQALRSGIARTTTRLTTIPDVHQAAQESPRREHDRVTEERFAERRLDPDGSRTLDDHSIDAGLPGGEAVLALDGDLHVAAVGGFIGLRTCGLDGWSLATVENPKLYARGVDRPRHLPPEGVDLLDEVAFPHAANRWIAGHLANVVEVLREEETARAHTGRSESGLDPRVAGTHHNDVPMFHVKLRSWRDLERSTHFPIQNLLNTRSSTSSAAEMPTISSSSRFAD